MRRSRGIRGFWDQVAKAAGGAIFRASRIFAFGEPAGGDLRAVSGDALADDGHGEQRTGEGREKDK